MKVKEVSEPTISVSEATPLKTKNDLFVIPELEEEPPKKETPKQKKKRVMSEAQLANLKKAREASMAKRRALKEAKDLEKATKKLERDNVRQAKLAKKEEQDDLIQMKAKLKMDAEKMAVWDEDRLTGLITKTLDTYMDKRKKEKAPQSRQQLVAPQPQAQPQQHYEYTNYPQQIQQPVYNQYQQQPKPRRRNNGFDDNPFANFM